MSGWSETLRGSLAAVAWLGAATICTGHAMATGPGAPIGIKPSSPSLPLLRNIAVFGQDDRVPLPANLSALADSVGLISSQSEKTLCTGFCVGRRTVATAAHCLFRTAGERSPDLGSFRFIVGASNKRRTSSIRNRKTGNHRQHVIAGSTSLKVSPPIDATHDWALIRLEEPICQNRALLVDKSAPAEINRLAARKRLLNIAFHGDRKDWRLAVTKSCTTPAGLNRNALNQLSRDFSDVKALVLHECDTGLASSGSPLLALANDNSLRVVAMNVGTYQQTRYLLTGRSVTRRFKPATIANTGISGLQFSDPVLAFARADILENRAAIRELQNALKAAGFATGPMDGIFGLQTRQALVAFERATGRAALGLATRQVLVALRQYR